MKTVGQQPTFIWLDHIGAIYGGSANMTGSGGTARLSLETQLQDALAADSSGAPMLFPIVIYDLPDRDCAALASNGELSISNNGLQYYEQDYITPIAQILSAYEHTSLRIIAVIEPDSLPNLVTNESVSNCAQANSSGVYVDGIQYALNQLHAIPNVYNYIDSLIPDGRSRHARYPSMPRVARARAFLVFPSAHRTLNTSPASRGASNGSDHGRPVPGPG